MDKKLNNTCLDKNLNSIEIQTFPNAIHWISI